MTYDEFEKAEPALVSGLFTGLAGFAALLPTSFSTVHGAGLAVGMSASQALLTRPAVYSPRSVARITGAGGGTPTIPPSLFGAGAGWARPDEPTATIGVAVFLVGFLVQLFAGVELIPSLATAAGLAGVQTVATRSRAYSPAKTQLLALLSQPGPDDAEEPPTPSGMPDPGGGGDTARPASGRLVKATIASVAALSGIALVFSGRRSRSDADRQASRLSARLPTGRFWSAW